MKKPDIKKNLIIINNLNTFEEVFIGSNYKSYKHKYFLSYILKILLSKHMKFCIEWVNIDDCNLYIRDLNGKIRNNKFYKKFIKNI